MNNKYFIDTNVWLYGFMKSDVRHKTASLLIAGENVILSTQVLNEICINLIKRAEYSEDEINKLIKNIYRKFDVVKQDEESILLSSRLRDKYKFDYWDSMKISIALKAKCKILFSDKHESGMIIEDNLKLINPFEQ